MSGKAPSDGLTLARLSGARGWVLDVDGCIMRSSAGGGDGGTPIKGAVELLRWLKARGCRVVICTNASQKTAAYYAAHLRAAGFDVDDAEMMTAGTAAAATILGRHGDAVVLAIGDIGLTHALEAAGARLWRSDREVPGAVVVGDAAQYSARDINQACLAVADHAAAFYVTVNLPWFHGGLTRSVTASSAIASAIQSVTGVVPTVCGKPSEAMARLLCERLNCAPAEIVVVGDMAEVEVAMARAMGAQSVLVLSGGTSREASQNLPAELRPDICLDDIGALLVALQDNEERESENDHEQDATMSRRRDRFDFFHEVTQPEGAEGWERMYPYFLVSQPEGREAEDGKFWFSDSVHWARAVHPFDSIGAEAVYYGAGYSSARSIALPTSLGLDLRMFNGFVYISPQAVVDGEEIGRRAALFEERAGFYYQNWATLYANWKEKMQASIEVMKRLRFDPLPEYEPIEVVREGRGRSVSWDLIENYHRLINEFFLVWQYHFENLGLGYGAYMVFVQFCKESFPGIEDQTIARMVAGVEGILFRPDDELRRLAKRAVR
ncbi:MAG: HAD-IIA family hydrolase, partial [Alphaproteobacteria bacterium]|nr:HAD-IIA family hydrolase [Alphaproteobacteria bacterium]